MGRTAKYGRDQILDAALAITAEGGPGAVTMGAVAARLGAPTGSLYHRFASRDLMLATLWIRTVRAFQRGFVEALAAGDARAAALHTPRWCRQNPAGGALLMLHRRRELAARWPADVGTDVSADVSAGVGTDVGAGVGADLEGVHAEVAGALDAFVAAHPGLDRERLIFATVDVPYGAVRRHLLEGRPPPPVVDELVASVCDAILPPPSAAGDSGQS